MLARALHLFHATAVVVVVIVAVVRRYRKSFIRIPSLFCVSSTSVCPVHFHLAEQKTNFRDFKPQQAELLITETRRKKRSEKERACLVTTNLLFLFIFFPNTAGSVRTPPLNFPTRKTMNKLHKLNEGVMRTRRKQQADGRSGSGGHTHTHTHL